MEFLRRRHQGFQPVVVPASKPPGSSGVQHSLHTEAITSAQNGLPGIDVRPVWDCGVQVVHDLYDAWGRSRISFDNTQIYLSLKKLYGEIHKHCSRKDITLGLSVFSLPISLVMIERIYILCLIIIMNSEVRTVTPCLGLGHETMVCAVCLSISLLTIFVPGCTRGRNCNNLGRSQ